MLNLLTQSDFKIAYLNVIAFALTKTLNFITFQSCTIRCYAI